jgi:hypothetical protein
MFARPRDIPRDVPLQHETLAVISHDTFRLGRFRAGKPRPFGWSRLRRRLRWNAVASE